MDDDTKRYWRELERVVRLCNETEAANALPGLHICSFRAGFVARHGMVASLGDLARKAGRYPVADAFTQKAWTPIAEGGRS